jgi:hypothetical protein
LFIIYAAKKHLHRRNLPRPEDFSKALYTIDIGQNDIAAGFRTMSNEQFEAVIPDIIDQLAAAVQVSCIQCAMSYQLELTTCESDQTYLLCVMAQNELSFSESVPTRGKNILDTQHWPHWLLASDPTLLPQTNVWHS